MASGNSDRANPASPFTRTGNDDSAVHTVRGGSVEIRLDLPHATLSVRRGGEAPVDVPVPDVRRCTDPQTVPRKLGYECPCEPILGDVAVDESHDLAFAEVAYVLPADGCNMEPTRRVLVRLPRAGAKPGK